MHMHRKKRTANRLPDMRVGLPLLICPHGSILRMPETPTCGTTACHRRWWLRVGAPVFLAGILIGGAILALRILLLGPEPCLPEAVPFVPCT